MLKKENYFLAVYRPYTPFFFDLLARGINAEKHYLELLKNKFSIKEFISIDGDVYYNTKELEAGGQAIFQEISSTQKVNKMYRILEKRKRILLNSVGKSLVEFSRAYERYMPALIVAWIPEKIIEHTLRKNLLEKITLEETEKLMHLLNIPLRENFFRREEYDLVMAKDLQEHVRKYEWINSRYGEYHPLTVKKAKERLQKINKKIFLQARKESQRKVKEAITQAKKILGAGKAYLVDYI